jgi:catechol 2,3-dioxygenase-like lactoylglutathione lyase family enzyme
MPAPAGREAVTSDEPRFRSISAITLATADMACATAFYTALGLRLLYGGPQASFSSFALGTSYLNLIAATDTRHGWWGRVIIYVDDVDALHARAVAHGLQPSGEPRDASWGERFFHITDPDGHELSFARPLTPRQP